MRPRLAMMIASAVLVPIAAVAAEDRTFKMYDLRDLGASLPAMAGTSGTSGLDAFAGSSDSAGTGGASVPVLADIPLINHFFRTQPGTNAGSNPVGGEMGTGAGAMDRLGGPGTSTDPLSAFPEDSRSPTDHLVYTVCTLLSMSHEELVENVYFVDGEEADHRKFTEVIQSVRALYLERVQIEVTCYAVDAESAPEIGAPAPQGTPALRSRTVAVRGATSVVQATNTQAYISRWTPIVGDSSVGLEPTTSTVTDGLMLGVRVSGSDERARVTVRGTISKAEINTAQVPADQAMVGANANLNVGGAMVTIGLPQVARRTVNSELALEAGRPTVVATVPGFQEGQQIVVVVNVKAAK